MSVIPARRQCDLCKNDVPATEPCARLTYPLEPSEPYEQRIKFGEGGPVETWLQRSAK